MLPILHFIIVEEDSIYPNCECWIFWRMHFSTLCAFGSMHNIPDLALHFKQEFIFRILERWHKGTQWCICPFCIPKPVWMKSTLISEEDYHKCYTLLPALHKCSSGQAALRGIALNYSWGGIISSQYLHSSFCVPVLSQKGCTSRQNAVPKLDKSLKTWAVMQFLRWAW